MNQIHFIFYVQIYVIIARSFEQCMDNDPNYKPTDTQIVGSLIFRQAAMLFHNRLRIET